MKDEKESGSSWEESERLGPYQLHEQMQQAARERGELYRATNETSGATALVLKPTAEDEDGETRRKDWQVRCVSSSSPDYLALEVERTPWSVSPDRHSAEALVFTFEDLREGVRRMARHLPTADEPRPKWRLGLALASAAAACALLFALANMSRPPDGPDSEWRAALSPMNPEGVQTDTAMPFEGISLTDSRDGGSIDLLARPLPSKPYKGQKRPPCTPRIEVEIMGGCWVPHKLKAPCPEELHEYQGECYTIAVSAKPPPQSLGQ
ncbi:hypothetical protein JQX13_19805 [Archangium violaceum]|uniref:hypothetical protein n=1 Tax=Archangium violaceum TaxID=83451 RepID=UPI00193C82F6|nr:hypothetical protein [Archangium violaceum]QRK12090.1 hypothetical protein JQX13_19805 [Archangium violaceum]